MSTTAIGIGLAVLLIAGLIGFFLWWYFSSRSAAAPVNAPPPAPVPAPTPSTAPAPPSLAAPAPSDPGVVQAWLQALNPYRTRVCAPALTWNNELAQMASTWLATQSVIAPRTSAGQLPGQTTGGSNKPYENAQNWFDQYKLHDFASNYNQPNSSMFSQLAWKGSTQVGCASRTLNNQQTTNACLFLPAGNVAGQFTANVQKPDTPC